MAAEALATEKVAEELVEEIKTTEDIINVTASAAGSEERPEYEKIDPVAVDVKEKDVKESISKILASDIAEKGEFTKEEHDTLAVEPLAEVHEELKNNPDDTDIPEPPEEQIGKSAEDSEEPLLKLSESQAAEEPAISEAMSKEERPTEEVPETSVVSEIDNKSELPIAPTVAITSPDDSGSAEISQIENSSAEEHEEKSESLIEEPPVIDSSKAEEASDKLSDVERGKATSESVDAATEVSELEGENGSGGVEVAEEKNETEEGENTTLVDTTRDADVEGLKATDSTALDLEETEKLAEQNPVKSAKDVEDTTTEVPSKAPQREGNLFSKMKQSIVKVKKAIVGKSPNSKTMKAEGNGDKKFK